MHQFLLSQHNILIIGCLHNDNNYLCYLVVLNGTPGAPDNLSVIIKRRFTVWPPAANEHKLRPSSSQACVCRD